MKHVRTARPFPPAAASLLAVLLLGVDARAQFVDNTADIPSGSPGNDSYSENVDFADVDLDGDWDAVFADGGDCCNDQNRLWINQGGAQGGTLGVFVDCTATQLPNVLDTSRDVEFADIDRDGDPDLFVSNTSAIRSQANRFWINQGGLQGGQAGFYVDDSANRWVGLGGAGSSVHPSFVLAAGFVDWSCDSDFGDLDNDGDLDLVQSTYGSHFSGQVPTRVFLNDGAGAFSEFNPSGHQVGPTGVLVPGDPGVWCDGVFQPNTTDATGVFCDVTTAALDVELGDVDGDFDLDLLHGDRDDVPRMFANRLDGSDLAPSAGGLAFRDVTGSALPTGEYSSAGGNYEQEMGDLDGDGDLDIYGLNWGADDFSLEDVTLRNAGNGFFDDVTLLPGSFQDENEADFLDYDNDGDLDVFVANWPSSDRLYRNTRDGGAAFGFVDASALVPIVLLTSLDADACDVDGDGDYDVFVATNAARNIYYENESDVPDTTPPYVPSVEQAPNRAPGGDPTVVRAHVYDNTPYYITWYDDTRLEYSVDGGTWVQVPMASSGGQVFRGEIPGGLVGSVRYRVVSSDEHGNQGQSGMRAYVGGDGLGARYCAPVPNSTGATGEVHVTGSDVVAADDLTLTALRLPPAANIGYFVMGTGTNTFTPPGSAGPICVTPGLQRYLPPVGNTQELSGGFTRTVGTSGPVSGLISAGSTWNFQAWHRDGMAPSNLTDAVSVTFQ